ncbi:hypothetical protein STENM223S_02680 [Streptomyces tendae]
MIRSGSTPAYDSPRSVSGVPSYSPSSSGSSAGGSSSTNTATLSMSRISSGGIRSSASATSSSNSSRVISSTKPLSGTIGRYEMRAALAYPAARTGIGDQWPASRLPS